MVVIYGIFSMTPWIFSANCLPIFDDGLLLIPVKRGGAWVRVYGVPLQAWSEDFFKLCVMSVGRFIRADACSIDKAKLDYVRVLITHLTLK